MLNKTKERIANFFNEEIFLAGKTIFDENKMGSSAFLIKEGTVLMISRKSPVSVMYTLLLRLNALNNCKTQPIFLKNVRGYLSETAHTHQIGEASVGDWIGDEIIVRKSQPYICTYIAKTQCVLLEIKMGNLNKLSEDLDDSIKLGTHNKLQWFSERFKDIHKTISDFDRFDQNTLRLHNIAYEVTKEYPQAIVPVLKNFQIQKMNRACKGSVHL
jgi:CRP-like cAMP-binding protein